LKETTEEKDLGVVVSSNLKPSKQCQQAYTVKPVEHLV